VHPLGKVAEERETDIARYPVKEKSSVAAGGKGARKNDAPTSKTKRGGERNRELTCTQSQGPSRTVDHFLPP